MFVYCRRPCGRNNDKVRIAIIIFIIDQYDNVIFCFSLGFLTGRKGKLSSYSVRRMRHDSISDIIMAVKTVRTEMKIAVATNSNTGIGTTIPEQVAEDMWILIIYRNH